MLKKVNKAPTDNIKKAMLGKCHQVLNHENSTIVKIQVFYDLNIVFFHDNKHCHISLSTLSSLKSGFLDRTIKH